MAIADKLMAGQLAADELLRRCCTLVYADCGAYKETGRRRGLDRRTVKAKVDRERLSQLTDGSDA